jgi:hypothetical protein
MKDRQRLRRRDDDGPVVALRARGQIGGNVLRVAAEFLETILLGWKFLFCECPIDISFPQWPTSFDPMKICARFANLLKMEMPVLEPVPQGCARKLPQCAILVLFLETWWRPRSYDGNLSVQFH